MAVVIFPLKRKLLAGGMLGYENIAGTEEMKDKINKIKEIFCGFVVENNNVSNELCEILIEYLAQENV